MALVACDSKLEVGHVYQVAVLLMEVKGTVQKVCENQPFIVVREITYEEWWKSSLSPDEYNYYYEVETD